MPHFYVTAAKHTGVLSAGGLPLAIAFLTLLGAAGEATGLDMHFKANTVKTRTHSLFRQGCMYRNALPTMRDEWLSPLLKEFERLLAEHRLVEEAFSHI